MKLWQIGLIIFILAALVNAILMKNEIGGLPRELTRLSVLAGMVLLIIGFFTRKK